MSKLDHKYETPEHAEIAAVLSSEFRDHLGDDRSWDNCKAVVKSLVWDLARAEERLKGRSDALCRRLGLDPSTNWHAVYEAVSDALGFPGYLNERYRAATAQLTARQEAERIKGAADIEVTNGVGLRVSKDSEPVRIGKITVSGSGVGLVLE